MSLAKIKTNQICKTNLRIIPYNKNNPNATVISIFLQRKKDNFLNSKRRISVQWAALSQ